jgi:hypothetical protein
MTRKQAIALAKRESAAANHPWRVFRWGRGEFGAESCRGAAKPRPKEVCVMICYPNGECHRFGDAFGGDSKEQKELF